MTQVKIKRAWHPSRLERQASEIARYDAEREAARIPSPILQEAREKYIAWEALPVGAACAYRMRTASPFSPIITCLGNQECGTRR